MTRADREHLLQRYLEGAMSSAEEEEFLIRAALNTDLRMELKAHQTIDRALRKDRTSGAVEHTALRARMAASLAANPAPQGVVPPAATAPATTAVTGGGAGWSIWGGSAMLGGLSVIVALLLTLNPFASNTPEPAVSGKSILVPTPVLPMPPLQNSMKTDALESTRRGESATAARNGESGTPSASAASRSVNSRASGRRGTGAVVEKSAADPSRTTSARRSTRSADPLEVKANVTITPNKDDANKKR